MHEVESRLRKLRVKWMALSVGEGDFDVSRDSNVEM